jgi:hypothetical protein
MDSNAYPGGYTDPVMAEYITIMIINNKTAGRSTFLPDLGHFTLVGLILTFSATTAQITSELEDCKLHMPFRPFHAQLTSPCLV